MRLNTMFGTTEIQIDIDNNLVATGSDGKTFLPPPALAAAALQINTFLMFTDVKTKEIKARHSREMDEFLDTIRAHYTQKYGPPKPQK